MDAVAAKKPVAINRWLPYWAVFQADVGHTLQSWVYRVWVLASLMAMTGYLLYMLAGDKAYRDFADPEADLPKAAVMDPFADDPVALENKVAALLKP